MMKKINWLKVMSIGGTLLGIIGTFLSGYADSKQQDELIRELVAEKMKEYEDGNNENAD